MSSEALAFDNPIVHIEEFGRMQLAHRRGMFPSTVLVYRAKSGKLSSPAGGYTAGELFWRRPREAYHVDVARHPCALDCLLTFGEPPDVVAARLAASWQVTNPQQVVASRVTQARFVALFVAWSWCVQAIDLHRVTSTPELFQRLGDLLPVNLRSTFGIDIDILGIQAISRADTDGSSDLRAMEMVLGAEATSAWHADFNLAQAALLAIPSKDRLPGDPLITEELAVLSRRVIQRFADVVERFGELLPYEGDNES